eukprot:scaffold1419_cov410-Prasinococcus_capsulatus_cf.AAC.23
MRFKLSALVGRGWAYIKSSSASSTVLPLASSLFETMFSSSKSPASSAGGRKELQSTSAQGKGSHKGGFEVSTCVRAHLALLLPLRLELRLLPGRGRHQ